LPSGRFDGYGLKCGIFFFNHFFYFYKNIIKSIDKVFLLIYIISWNKGERYYGIKYGSKAPAYPENWDADRRGSQKK